MTLKNALRAANKELQTYIDGSLTTHVFPVIQKEELDAIFNTVYNVYAPKMYTRRGSYGGLGDAGNIVMEGGSAYKGVLSVINITDPNPGGVINVSDVTTDKDLPELVEYGHGYNGNRYDFLRINARYIKPRPFTETTIQNLNNNRAHVMALAAGLRFRGYTVIVT